MILQFSESCKGWKKVQLFRKREYNYTSIRFPKMRTERVLIQKMRTERVGKFLCGVERVESVESVLWRFISIASFATLKRISEISTLPTLEKFMWLPMAASVAASQLALWWMCNSPRMGCAWRTTPKWHEQVEIK